MLLAPDHLNSAVIQHSFGRLQAEQGESFARLGAVELQATAWLNATDIEISGLVLDQRARPFGVQIYYQPGEDWVLSGDCTCPAGSDCRHCAALAFAWLACQPQPAASEAELGQWLAALAAVEAPPAPVPTAGDQQLLYLLDLSEGEEPGLRVQAALRERGAGKAWRRPQPLSVPELMRHPLAGPADTELAGLLRSQQPGRIGEPLPGAPRRARRAEGLLLGGSMGFLLLEQLLASGRAFWSDARAQLGKQALSAGEERPVRFGWREVPGGQKLEPRLDPPAERVFQLGRKVFYFDAEAAVIGPVDLTPEKWALLARAPVVPPTAIESVSRSLLSLLPAPLPSGSSLREELVRESLVPVLTLQGLPESPAAADGTSGDTAAAEHQALLHFAYGGHRIAATGPVTGAAAAETTLVQGETVFRVLRDSEAEQQARRQLLQTGLLPLEGGDRFSFARPAADESGLPEPYLRSWHHWLGDSLAHLRALGWQIEIEPGFRLAFVSSPAWQADLKGGELQHKWFDLALGIDLHGERVELLPLLLRLLRTVPDPRAMRDKLEQHDTWLLPLDPHPLKSLAAKVKHQRLPQRWLEIPARRLARVLDMLIEIYDYLPGEDEPEALRLSAFTALQLLGRVRQHPDDYGVSWQAPPGLASAAETLAGRPQDGLNDVPLPPGLDAVPRPYQQRGLNWLQTLRELGLNGILADEMGLGKTLQTLAHLLVEKAAGRLDAPALVVAPTSVLGNWVREAARFAPDLKVLLLHGPERPQDPRAWAAAELVLTSYTLMRQDVAHHRQISYSWLILDEAQQIKNPRSRTAKMACAQPARHRLCLTGTPLENHLEELWSLFHFLMPGFLDTLDKFNSRYRHPIERQGDTRRQLALRERIRPLLLRRRKTDVERELPPKIEILRSAHFGTAQRDLYETMRLAVDTRVNKLIREQGFKRSRILILDALLKLRQICCDPRLLDLPEAQKIRRSAKLELLMELLPELVAEGRRILIFSQFVKMLELIEAQLQPLGIPYTMLTGRTRRRQAVIDSFQAGEVPVFLISLKAGGLGLNLTTADTVIHYDPWWNPASEQQAEDRAWRIGQTRPVFVYRLIAAGTVEESILKLQESKLALHEGLFEADPTAGLRAETLLGLLRGAEP